jgi:hypothetical protein
MATWHPGYVPPGKFIPYLLTKYQIPSSNDALGTDNQSKGKIIFARQPPGYFTCLYMVAGSV